MKEISFENAIIGDRVWTIEDGWGSIVKIDDKSKYPIKVEFEPRGKLTFTKRGFYLLTDKRQSLFWDELKYEVPTKPIRRNIFNNIKFKVCC